MTWSEHSLDVFLKVVTDNPQAIKEELRNLVSAAYPFGPRRMFHYKAWLKAV